MKNLTDLSEPQVLKNEQKDKKIQFSICLPIQFSMGEKHFLTLKLNKL